MTCSKEAALCSAGFRKCSTQNCDYHRWIRQNQFMVTQDPQPYSFLECQRRTLMEDHTSTKRKRNSETHHEEGRGRGGSQEYNSDNHEDGNENENGENSSSSSSEQRRRRQRHFGGNATNAKRARFVRSTEYTRGASSAAANADLDERDSAKMKLIEFLKALDHINKAPRTSGYFHANNQMLRRATATFLYLIVGEKAAEKYRSFLTPFIDPSEDFSKIQNIIWYTNRQQASYNISDSYHSNKTESLVTNHPTMSASVS